VVVTHRDTLSCDADVAAYVVETLDVLPLAGAYVHGSLAMGCYHRAHSDLDLLLVVDEPLDAAERRRVARTLAQRSVRGRPTEGDLELSVLTREQARRHRHPRPFEVHYSARWTADILADRVDYDADRTDPDLAAHITVVLSRGLVLLGPPAEEMFAPVPHADYLEAITSDLADAWDDPVYGVLNACRVLAVLARGPGTVLNKAEGGSWALGAIPARHRAVVEQALAAYKGGRRQAWDRAALDDFAGYVAGRLPRKTGH
jgi:predicted nucleotidyltransferase